MYDFDSANKADVKKALQQTINSDLVDEPNDSDRALKRLGCDGCNEIGSIHPMPNRYMYKCSVCGKSYHTSIITRMLLSKADSIRNNTSTDEIHHLNNEPGPGAELNFGTNDRF